ncbi:hypothetical protein L1049_005656 [Liquidambar formosana]|uniref:Uncharacterized protein n=1 Tax=Liquidambar formosana TaxID=63359 RepID=A0AAP0RFQ2_LIQFO
MASSVPSFFSLGKLPLCKHKVMKCPKVRSQSYHDEVFSCASEITGNSANIVDANLSVLRQRMEELRKKESSFDQMK